MPIRHPFPRGFVIHHPRTGQPRLPQSWVSTALGQSGWVFSHDPAETPQIAVETARDGAGDAPKDADRWVLVHGLCLYAGADEPPLPVAERLLEAAGTSHSAFLDTLDVLGGRHVVLLGRGQNIELFQDALGMRSVYFDAEAELVSSHAHLLEAIHPHRPRTADQGRENVAAAWSRTIFHGVDALLPNHSLRLDNWTVERFFPRESNTFTDLSVAERVDMVTTMWDRQMADLVSRDVKLVMSLTGGADSRTNLALSWTHRQEMELFTYTAKAKGKNKSKFLKSYARDKTIVDKLLALIPDARHTYFYIEDDVEALDSGLQDAVARNTTVSHGAWLLPHYVREFEADNYVHLRGFGYEIGRAYWAVTRENDTLDSLRTLFLQRMQRQDSPEPEAQRLAYFEDGLRRWQYDENMHGYHKRDLYYWEMRMGRWGSEVMNETDIAFQTCVGFNVRRMLELSLSFELEDRRSGFFFAELINSSHPVLNFLGKNDVRNLYEITRDEQRRSVKKTPLRQGPALTQELTVSQHGKILEQGPVAENHAGKNTLVIPARWFRPGAVCARSFQPMTTDGDLRFRVTSTYGYAAARDHWRMQIWVNDRLQASWDGGGSKAPVNISVVDLRQGDVVSVAAMPLLSHEDSESWSSASKARIVETGFTPRDAENPVSVWGDAPSFSKPTHDDRLRLTLQDVPALTPEVLAPDTPTRVDLDLGPCVVPLLVVRRQHNDPGLVTLFNGAVDLERSQGAVVFQRSTWWPELPWSQIYVADPGTVGEDALSLSWGQISREFSAIPGVVRAIRHLASVLGIEAAQDRLYFGSSAGGFWAWSCAVMDPGARAVVNNAQIDWTRWMAGAVNDLRRLRFENLLPLEIRTQLPTRSSVLQLWKQQGHATRIDYWVNTSSGHDRVVDLPQVEAFARENPELTQNLRIHRYRDEASGHNPVGREATVQAITEALQARELRVGLVGFFGWGNYGDELMRTVWQTQLPFETGLVHDIMGKPYFTRAVSSIAQEFDAFVIGGGDLILPRRVSALYWNRAWLTKPCFVAGIGVALEDSATRPDVGPRIGAFLENANVHHISTRDAASAQWIKDHAPTTDPGTSPDLAFALPLETHDDAAHTPPPSTGPRRMGIVVRKNLTPEIAPAVERMTNWARARGMTAEFLVAALGSEADDELATITRHWPDSPVRVEPSVSAITRALRDYDVVASAKFHVSLMAVRQGVPVVTLRSTHKITQLAGQLQDPGLAELISSEHPDEDIDRLVQRSIDTDAVSQLERSAQREVQRVVAALQDIRRTQSDHAGGRHDLP